MSRVDDNPEDILKPSPLEERVTKLKTLLNKIELTRDEKKLKNNLLRDKETLEINFMKRIANGEIPKKYEFLYPSLLDPLFSGKIAKKAEFYDNRYEEETRDLKQVANTICDKPFEINPHQQFVRSFLSSDTPYNGLLLFHGLGTGKTCSAISICENIRKFNRQINNTKRIIVIASPNIQDNFKLQLFDERKLKKVNDMWNIRSCTGNTLLQEINPMNMEGLTKTQITKQIKKLIRDNYSFVGYTQFSNMIENIVEKYNKPRYSKGKQRRLVQKHIQKMFSDRIFIIDEVHNIRVSSENAKKSIGRNLISVLKYSNNTKLVLMSATPLFNDYKEIIFLTNLLNINDGRSRIKLSDVFNKNGEFKKDSRGKNVGRNNLINKLRGYVSFLQGENPYTFPFRVYPKMFDVTRSSLSEITRLPRLGPFGTIIKDPLKHMDIYMTNLGDYQRSGYEYIIRRVKTLPKEDEVETKFGWQVLDPLIQSLNIVYPNTKLMNYIEQTDRLDEPAEGAVLEGKVEDIEEPDIEVRGIIGSRGLKKTMDYDTKKKRGFKYKEGIEKQFGRIFSLENIGKYSGKIQSLMNNIVTSSGIVLIYTQYIDGGAIPIALALEELGITRYGRTSNLFEKSPTRPLNAYTMKPRETRDEEPYKPAKYVVISGDKKISPNNISEIKASTNDDNYDGSDVKVIIITRAGSEGIDFKNIRQVHILDPWYNNSRNEQTIGRAVRNCSHKLLPFEERNVEVYMYGTNSYGEIQEDEREMIDMYVYRTAERKSILIGNVTRVMKEIAVDCILNKPKNQLTVEKMGESVEQILSSGKKIEYPVGLKPFSALCDYKERCEYRCIPDDVDGLGEDKATYNEKFITLNIDRIIDEIKKLFRGRFIFKRDELFKRVQQSRKYPVEQINAALDYLIDNGSEVLVDNYNRNGNLMNIGEYYLFQPLEFRNQRNTVYDRKMPIPYKKPRLVIELSGKSVELDIADESIRKTEDEDMGSRVFQKISATYKTLVDSTSTRLMEQLNSIIKLISDDIEDISVSQINNLILQHVIDELSIEDKHILIKYISNIEDDTPIRKPGGGGAAGGDIPEGLDSDEIGERPPVDDVTQGIIDYLKETVVLDIPSMINPAFLLLEESYAKRTGRGRRVTETTVNMYSLNDENEFEKLPPSKLRRAVPIIKDRVEITNKKSYNNIVGFFNILKPKESFNFRMKNMNNAKEKGSVCSQSSKQKIIEYLALIIYRNSSPEFTSRLLGILKEIGIKVKTQLCNIMEYILRYLQSINYKNKVWFLYPEQASLNNIKETHK